jgi:hypothetical protein
MQDRGSLCEVVAECEHRVESDLARAALDGLKEEGDICTAFHRIDEGRTELRNSVGGERCD